MLIDKLSHRKGTNASIAECYSFLTEITKKFLNKIEWQPILHSNVLAVLEETYDCKVSRPTVVRLMALLEEDSIIESRPCRVDKRLKEYRLLKD